MAKQLFFLVILLISCSAFSAPPAQPRVNQWPTSIHGNLIDGTISTVDLEARRHPGKTVVMFHSCNLKHIMGNAAGAVEKAMPIAGDADKQNPVNDKRYLGGWSAAKMKTPADNSFIVLNFYTQQDPGHVPNAQAHLELIENGLKNIAEKYPSDQYILVYPEFSSGVAGRDWERDIKPLTKRILGGHIRYEINWDGSRSNAAPIRRGKVITGHCPGTSTNASLGKPTAAWAFQHPPTRPSVTIQPALIDLEKQTTEKPTRKKRATKAKKPAKKTPQIDEEKLKSAQKGEQKEVPLTVEETPIEEPEKTEKEQTKEKWYQTNIAKGAAVVSGVTLVTAAIGYGIYKINQKHTNHLRSN